MGTSPDIHPALHNWLPMIRLALPGLVMVEAECLAFEILTLAASYFGTSHLAAQSVLATITSFTFQYVYLECITPFLHRILGLKTYLGNFHSRNMFQGSTSLIKYAILMANL